MAGGVCTSWKRKGYLFEGAVHWLTGSNPKTELYRLWRETGALNDAVKVYTPDIFHAIEWNGQIIYLFRDIEKTVEQLIALSPDDEKRLRRLVKDVKTFSRMQMPVLDIKGVKMQNPKRMTIGAILKMLPVFPIRGRLSKISCKEYPEQFKHPGIQSLFHFLPDSYLTINLISKHL